MSFIAEAAKYIVREIREPFEYQIINYAGEAIYLEGFIRATKLTDSQMEFLCKKKLLTVAGKNLVVTRITDGTALIEGKIEGVYESE